MTGNSANDRYVAVIQAGGRGTRLRELTRDQIPKPLLPLNGKPMIQWQIENISRYGIRNFVVVVGYLGEKILEYFGDGNCLGVHIDYVEEAEDNPLGSAGALYYLKPWIRGRDVFLAYGDVMFDVDLARMFSFHACRGGQATILVHPNSHPYDSDLVVLDKDAKVTGFDLKRESRDYDYENLVNAGIYILSASVIEAMEKPEKLDLEKDLLSALLQTGRVCGYRTPEYIKDAGTPERFYAAAQEQAAGLWTAKNLARRQKGIFIDWDGIRNARKALITDVEEMELEEGAAEAVRMINQSEYLAVAVTGQSVVEQGMCSVEKSIHKRLSVLLGEQGAFLDDVAFRSYHSDREYQNENSVDKVSCRCRKSQTGMLGQMAERYHIDLSQSYLIGVTIEDIRAGVDAGIKTVLVRAEEAGEDRKYAVKPDMVRENLLDAVKEILGRNEDKKYDRLHK